MSNKYFVCNTCSKEFPAFFLLERHMKRKYPCKPRTIQYTEVNKTPNETSNNVLNQEVSSN